MPGEATRTLEDALITLADSADGGIAAGLADLGPERCADALLHELVCRASLAPEPAVRAEVRVALRFGGQALEYTVTLGAGTAEVAQGRPEGAIAALGHDLVELLRAVYGPQGRHNATLELHVADPAHPVFNPADPAQVERMAAITALHQLTAALSRPERSLDELAVRFQSDKWGGHWYTPHYERYFAPYRNRPVTVLEIGIGGYGADEGGASLRMWKHYFPRATVYGLDIHEKPGVAEPRVVPLCGDQGNVEHLERIAAETGPFDIVIDDGSHLNQHVLTSFHTLFPHVRTGGLYVIEDTQTAYWPGWGGNASDLNDPKTSMGMIKMLLDGLNHQERPTAGGFIPSYTDRNISGVHVHHNLAVVEKAVNTEQGAPAWVPRGVDPDTWFTGGTDE